MFPPLYSLEQIPHRCGLPLLGRHPGLRFCSPESQYFQWRCLYIFTKNFQLTVYCLLASVELVHRSADPPGQYRLDCGSDAIQHLVQHRQLLLPHR
jgi:hypothetical protein